MWQQTTRHVEPQLSSLMRYSVWVASSSLKEEKYCRTVVRTVVDLVSNIEIRHGVLPNTITTLFTNTSVLAEAQETTKRKDIALATKNKTRI